MSEVPDGLKALVELVAEIAMWKQKAHDLEKERDYLRERLVYLEKVVIDLAEARAARQPL